MTDDYYSSIMLSSMAVHDGKKAFDHEYPGPESNRSGTKFPLYETVFIINKKKTGWCRYECKIASWVVGH